MIRHPDILSGGGALILGAALIFFSQRIDIAPGEVTLSARFFPTIAASCVALCGLGIMIRGIVAAPAPFDLGVNRNLAAVAGLFLVYFLSFEYVDFRFGAWALTLACMFVLGARNRIQLAITPLAVSATVYTMFRYGFDLLLPIWT